MSEGGIWERLCGLAMRLSNSKPACEHAGNHMDNGSTMPPSTLRIEGFILQIYGSSLNGIAQ